MMLPGVGPVKPNRPAKALPAGDCELAKLNRPRESYFMMKLADELHNLHVPSNSTMHFSLTGAS
jgi:hypothetical protein